MGVYENLNLHFRVTAGIELEEETLVLGNAVELGNEGGLGGLLLGIIGRLLGVGGRGLEELDEGILDGVGTTGTALDGIDGGVEGGLLEGLGGRELAGDVGDGGLHEGGLGLLGVAGLLLGDHVEHLLDLGLEVVLGLDGAGGVEVLVGLLPEGVDGLEVLDLPLVGLEELELLLEGGDDLVLGLVVLLEDGLGGLVEGLVDGVSALGVEGDAEGDKDGGKLGLLVDDVPVELDDGDGCRYADGEGEPLREAGAEESALAGGGRRGGFGGLLFSSGRGVEGKDVRSVARGGTAGNKV